MDGQGQLIIRDGSIYQGVFRNDYLEGNGTLALKDGTVYKGNFS
jgi:hypothetical protein